MGGATGWVFSGEQLFVSKFVGLDSAAEQREAKKQTSPKFTELSRHVTSSPGVCVCVAWVGG